jgi:hypothetical protein
LSTGVLAEPDRLLPPPEEYPPTPKDHMVELSAVRYAPRQVVASKAPASAISISFSQPFYDSLPFASQSERDEDMEGFP